MICARDADAGGVVGSVLSAPGRLRRVGVVGRGLGVIIMGANLHVRGRIYQPDGILNEIKVVLSPEMVNAVQEEKRENRERGGKKKK